MSYSEYSLEAISLAVVPKFPAALSMLCSAAIAQRVIRSPKEKTLVYHRIILGLSISDILASFIYFMGTWLIPSGTTGQYGPVFMAYGTSGTCTYSGFFSQFAISSPLYNGTLCLYYLLNIRFHWTEKDLRKVEWLIHVIPIAFAFGTAITGVVLQFYGSVEWLCWINPDPPQPERPIWLYRWGFLFIPLWATVAFVSVVMIILWWTVRGVEKANDRYQFDGQVVRTHSKKTATQGMLYIFAFYVTWFFPSLQRVLELVLGKNFFVLQFFDTALLPLQGVFNYIIYIWPRFVRGRRRNRQLGFWKVLWDATMPELDSRRGSISGAEMVASWARKNVSRVRHHRDNFFASKSSQSKNSDSLHVDELELMSSLDSSSARAPGLVVNAETGPDVDPNARTSDDSSTHGQPTIDVAAMCDSRTLEALESDTGKDVETPSGSD